MSKLRGLTIKCEMMTVDTRHNSNDIVLGLSNIDTSFLADIGEDILIEGFDNRLLFEKLIENDETLLHDYLTKSGYIFSKA